MSTSKNFDIILAIIWICKVVFWMARKGLMTDKTTKQKIEKFFCNACKQETKHFVQAEYEKIDHDDESCVSYAPHLLIVECCGCEHLAMVKRTRFNDDVGFRLRPLWGEEIYPPVIYRSPPP